MVLIIVTYASKILQVWIRLGKNLLFSFISLAFIHLFL